MSDKYTGFLHNLPEAETDNELAAKIISRAKDTPQLRQKSHLPGYFKYGLAASLALAVSALVLINGQNNTKDTGSNHDFNFYLSSMPSEDELDTIELESYLLSQLGEF